MNQHCRFDPRKAAAWARLARQGRFKPGKMARLAGISEAHLRRLCQTHLAQPLAEWLKDQRVIAARRLLAENGSVKTTATFLGYRYTTHFARHFQQAHGVSPSRFARRFEAWR